MYDELVMRLREHAEWAEANEWEVPIMLPDHLKQAADAIEELTAYVALYKDGGETAMAVVNDYKARLEELQGKADAYLDAMTYEHNRAARLLWDKEHCWIPVTERLPFAESGDASQKVLVTDGQDMAIAEWFNFEMCEPYWSYTGIGNITHWMPLPTPPTAEEGE